ncbi:MAG: aconitase X [Candidatus Poseidoniaceae archaeon]|nr:aconitase X [Candidatus Poseidoniaceae archaeon]
MELPAELKSMLAGEQGPTRQKAARLVVDLALTTNSEGFISVSNSHVSGVSVITGGHGLRRFLADISGDGKVAITTTLNSAGCDKRRMSEMDIDYPNFLEQQFEIIQAYENLGIQATLSCTPYDRGIMEESGIASWSESNAVAYTNSWTDLITNRESGLSALATALTGFSPRWGLHLEQNRIPNIVVDVNCELPNLSDWSILGDWIGKQIRPEWDLPYGPMPLIRGISMDSTFAQRKALTASAANYGCPMLWVEGLTTSPELDGNENMLVFGNQDLAERYENLSPKGRVDLVVIGCPQASLEEIRRAASAVRARAEMGKMILNQRLWVFTSGYNYDLALADGSIAILEESGALVLRDTCPEVTPYNRNKYNHLMTNSMKAEHYLTSGLNRIPTSVGTIEDCVNQAFNPDTISNKVTEIESKKQPQHTSSKTHQKGECELTGHGLDSQSDWSIEGRAMVSDVPITFLGYVNRDTGVVEEEGHPLDGRAIEDTILVYPKGSGSTVAPYVLMGLIYTGKGPRAIVNRDVCSLTLPACSLLGVPYCHGFDKDPTLEINDGDLIRLERKNESVIIEVIERCGD